MVVLNRKKISLVLAGIFLSIFLFIFTADNLNKDEEIAPTVSLPVSGKVIVIDSGHGRPDEGAESRTEQKVAMVQQKRKQI